MGKNKIITKINIGDLLSSGKIKIENFSSSQKNLPKSSNLEDGELNENDGNDDNPIKLNELSESTNNEFNECNICFEQKNDLIPMKCCNGSKLICHSCLCNSYLKKTNCPFCRENIDDDIIIFSCYRKCCEGCGDELRITSSCFKCNVLNKNNANHEFKKKYIKVKVNKYNVNDKIYINIIGNEEYDLTYNQSSILKCNKFRLNNDGTLEYYYGNGNFKKFNNNNYAPLWYPMIGHVNNFIN